MRFLTQKKIVVLILVLILVCAFFYHAYRTTSQFVAAYKAYAELSLEEENIIYVPAQPDNPTRQEMNLTLAQILGQKMTPIERLQKARRGEELAREYGHELDGIQDRGGSIDTSINAMEHTIDVATDLSSNGKEKEIVQLARKRADLVSDIRALTARANFEITDIFRRIQSEKGVLSDKYVTELNAEVPDAEKRFDMRTNDYKELQDLSDQIVKDYLELSVFGLPVTGK